MLSIMNKKTLHGLDIHPFDIDKTTDHNIGNNEDVIVEYVFEPDEEKENSTITSRPSYYGKNDSSNSADDDYYTAGPSTSWNVRGFTESQLSKPVSTELRVLADYPKSKDSIASPITSRQSHYGEEEKNDNSGSVGSDCYAAGPSTSWNVCGFGASQLSKSVSTELRVPENYPESKNSIATPITSKSQKNSTFGFNNKSTRSQTKKKIDCSRRRPTEGIKILSSSKFAEKYDILIDKRLVLVSMQIEEMEEEKVFKTKKNHLELQILQAQLDALRK